MILEFTPATGLLATLDLLQIEISETVLHVRLNRPAKRNAINDAMVAQLQTCFVNLPQKIGAVVLTGAGDHFCAGLDLSELSECSVAEGVLHSRSWHAAMDTIQFGRVPVVAVLQGAVVGGGLEIASSCHIRVAEASAYYGLPEGQRGIFVGGGGSARVPRLVGVACMSDMMRSRRAGGPATRLLPLPGRRRPGVCQRLRTGGKDRHQRALVQLRRHAGATAHRRPVAVGRLVRRVADGGHRSGRRRGQAACARLS